MTSRRALSLLRPHLRGVVGATLLLGITAALPGLAVLLLREALDEVLTGQPGARLGLLCAGLVGLTLAEGLTAIGRTALTKGIAWRVTSDLRRQAHRHLLRLSARQRGDTGASLAALTHDIDELQYGISALVTALRNPLSLAVLAAVAVSLAPGLALWGVALLPALALTGQASGRLLRRRARTQRQARAALLSLTEEQLQGLRAIQSAGAEAQEHARFVAAEEADRAARLRLEIDRVVPSIAARTVAVAGLAILLWAGARQVLAGTLQPGSLVAFAVALGLMSRPLGGLTEVWSLLQRSLSALERVEELLAMTPEPATQPPPAALPEGPLDLRWEGVRAGYAPDREVLRGIDLVARPGEILALVGPTGAGKSTLLSLVERSLDPHQGRVLLGGVDVRRLPLQTLRGALGVVHQEASLFGRTVAENLTLGLPATERAAQERALELAGADFVQALPEGLDSALAEGGRSLSGGERQRLCLARALLRDAPILLLDEATNQVDPLTERALMQRLQGVRAGRVVVMVAHDPGVARMADHVAVVAGGEVVEQGSPAELASRDGWFRRMLNDNGPVSQDAAFRPGGRARPSAVGTDNQE